MLWVVICLYALAAVFPLLGLIRLYRLARTEAARLDVVPKLSNDELSFEHFNVGFPLLVAGITSRPRAVMLDFLFIGVGVAFGTVASIWSLFL